MRSSAIIFFILINQRFKK